MASPFSIFFQIFFNVVILTSWDFDYPFFLVTWQCVLTSILTLILSWTTDLLPTVKERTVTVEIFMTRLLPLSFLFAYALAFGNMVYGYLSLSFIQMIKAVAPVPTLLLSYLFGREKATWYQLVIVIVVSGGAVLSSVGETDFSWIGFIMQVLKLFYQNIWCDFVLVFCCFSRVSTDLLNGSIYERH